MNPLLAMMGGGMPQAAPPMGGMMPQGMPPQGAMPSEPFPNVPQVDLMSVLQQFPGITPEMLLQLIGQTANPMQEAQMGRGAMAGQSNPMLAMLQQVGAAPVQSMQPQMAY